MAGRRSTYATERQEIGKPPLDVAQRGDGMDDHLGEAGRKGAPVRGLGDTRLDCARLENKKIWDTF